MQKKGVKIELSGLNDLNDYFRITDKANSKRKSLLNDLRQLQSLYEDATNLESSLVKYKNDFEKLADDYKKMGVSNVNPNQWQEYKDVLVAIKDLSQTKQIESAIRNAIKNL